MLSIRQLEAAYGTSQVLFDVALDIAEGEVVKLLGRNGMGKTTTVRAIMGLLAPRGGSIALDGTDIRGPAPEAVARRGLGLVPEGRQVFPTLTVRENLVATAANRLRRPDPRINDVSSVQRRHRRHRRTTAGKQEQHSGGNAPSP